MFLSYCQRAASPVATEVLPSINFFCLVNLFIGRGSSGYENYFVSSSVGKRLGNSGLKGNGHKRTGETFSPCDLASDQYSSARSSQ